MNIRFTSSPPHFPYKLVLFPLFFLLAISLAFTACKNDPDPDEETTPTTLDGTAWQTTTQEKVQGQTVTNTLTLIFTSTTVILSDTQGDFTGTTGTYVLNGNDVTFAGSITDLAASATLSGGNLILNNTPLGNLTCTKISG
jgi:hypothetical protein